MWTSEPPDARCDIPSILDSIVDYGIIVLDVEGRVALWNTGAGRLFQHGADEVLGRPVDLIFTMRDCAIDAPMAELTEAARDGVAEDNRWHLRKDGSLIWIDGSMSAMRAADGTLKGFIKIMHDGTERKRYETEIVRLARVDALTGLGNRMAFSERLEAEAGRRLDDACIVVLLIDLDRFKDVNDRFGHAAGDDVLREVTRRIRAIVRRSDLACRLGGDEFVVLHTGLRDAAHVARVAQALVDALAAPILLEAGEVRIGASIGLAVFPDDTRDPERLVRMADAAMYQVKRAGGGAYRFASRDADAAAHRLSLDRAELRHAVEAELFELRYQPQVDALSGRVDGVEALLRCTDPALAHLSVEEILDVARGAGLMREIGAWVLHAACSQGRAWQDAGYGPLKLCINLGAEEVSDPALVSRVRATLDATGLDPRWLEIELTERQAFEYTHQSAEALARLRASQVTLAIDDFGTGYSALGYLLKLPVDRLKLDRAFVQHVPDDPQSCALARAIVALAHIVGLPVVVEGIETLAQADFFATEGCETLQGFFFGHPMQASAMTARIAAGATVSTH